MRNQQNQYILRITAIYVVGALLWIFLSDRILSLFVDVHKIYWLSLAKGTFFVIVTGMLLYLALKRMPTPLKLEDQRRDRSHGWIGYGFALVVTSLAIWVRTLIPADFNQRPFFVLLILPVVASSYFGGLGPGLVATFGAALWVDYYNFPPLESISISNPVDVYQLAMFLAVGTILSFLSDALIRGRRRIEDALFAVESAHRQQQEKEIHYQSLFNNMLNGLTYCRILFQEGHPIDFEFLSVNDAFLFQTGLKDVVGKKMSAIIPDFSKSDRVLLAFFNSVLSDQSSKQMEYYSIGFGQWFMISAYSPTPDHFVAIYDMITERKRSEEAVLESELRLRKTLEAVNVVTWEFTIATGALRYSGCLEKIFGHADMEKLSTLDLFLIMVHSDDRPKLVHRIEGSLQNFDTFNAEYRIILPDGTDRWLQSIGDYVNEGGLPPRYLGMTADISERKHAEQRKQLHEAVFTNTQEGIIITDRVGTILSCNPAVSVITGYEEDELIGLNTKVLQSGRHEESFYTSIMTTIETFGFWQGEIWNRRKNGEVYPEWLTVSAVRKDDSTITHLIVTFTDISRLKQSESQMEHLAHHDPLTDLPNRLLLSSRLQHSIERAKRDNSQGAVLFLDLDRFKNVNDSLGHPSGDELLQLVALRLKYRLRDSDTLARMGGDEFVVLLEDIPSHQHAATVAQHLINCMVEPFDLAAGSSVYIGTSIGISIFPYNNDNASQIIRNADAALYVAKNAGRNTYRFYTQSLTDSANKRMELEARMRAALLNEDFVVYYQPLISLQTNGIIGVEALVRWKNHDGTLIPPVQFIPLAEETGLILPLGEWVLRTACHQMRNWLDQGLSLKTMAVNLSPLQFRQPGLVGTIHDILKETRLPSQYLELEITEGALMDASSEAELQLNELKSLGIRLAIDDFGTGYSSLAYLKRFPIDKLKVDQSFVRDIPSDPADMEIAAAVVALGKNLHLEVLAEGIENEDQLSFLRHLGCHIGQGYLFSKPISSEECDILLARPTLPI